MISNFFWRSLLLPPFSASPFHRSPAESHLTATMFTVRRCCACVLIARLLTRARARPRERERARARVDSAEMAGLFSSLFCPSRHFFYLPSFSFHTHLARCLFLSLFSLSFFLAHARTFAATAVVEHHSAVLICLIVAFGWDPLLVCFPSLPVFFPFPFVCLRWA